MQHDLDEIDLSSKSDVTTKKRLAGKSYGRAVLKRMQDLPLWRRQLAAQRSHNSRKKKAGG